MAKVGRPLKQEEITFEELATLMISHATKGGFIATLPAYVYEKTGICMSMSYIEKIKDEEFLRAKSVAKAVCADYWTKRVEMYGLSPSVWVFVMKNVANWRDMKDVKIESNNTNTEVSADDARKELDKLKAEIAEKV
jgi:hypothetical protein